MILKAGTHLFSCIMGLKLVIRPLTKSIVVPRLPQCCKLHMYIQRLVCFLVVVPYYSHMVIRHTFLKNNIYLPKYIPSYDTNSQDPAQLQNTSTCSQNTLLYNVQNNTTRYVQIIHTIIHMENINSSFINLAPTYELWFVYIM